MGQVSSATSMLTLSVVLYTAFLCWTGTTAQTGPGVSCVCLEELVSAQGLANPTAISHAADGSGRLFASDQNGLIWIFMPDGTRPTPPFLNITDRNWADNACGLLSFALHPAYANNGTVYVYYCIDEPPDITMRLSEFTVSETDPNYADPNTERVLLDINFGRHGHQGAGLLFGSDGYLYFSVGDGNCCSDPKENAQNKGTYQGSTHRFDVDSRTGNLPYGIPPDNPFLDDPEALPEMYAYGFRNPFKASMDRGDRNTGAGYGRIFIGDVGEATWEEVDILQAGGNYGWSGREGPECHNMTLCGNTEPEVFPVAYYNRTFGNCVIAGNVYRGCANPDLNGWFIYADHITSYLFAMQEVDVDVWEWQELPLCDTCPDGLTNIHPPYIVSFGEDEQGEIYFSATQTPLPSYPEASIFKVVDPNNNQPPCNA